MILMTTISVKENTWEKLNRLKKSGDTMDDVIKVLLTYYANKEENIKESTLSKKEFNQLLDELIPDDKEFNEYLENSRKSFSRGF